MVKKYLDNAMLKTKVQMRKSRRYCYAFGLHDNEELIAKYKEYHAPVNARPEIAKNSTDAGIVDMQIYVVGNRLFMIMEVDDSFNPDVKAKMDKENLYVQDREEMMSRYQQPLPWSKVEDKWISMEKIFQL